MTQVEARHAFQFDDAEQQHDAATLGMWVFLGTEVLFFGGLFTTYAVYRSLFPGAFDHASRELNVMLGGINTAVLLTSSLTMALAVRAAHLDRMKRTLGWLCLTALLGAAFLCIKGYEYDHKIHEHLLPGAQFIAPTGGGQGTELFFILYFIMTGLHAAHMVAGLLVMVWLLLSGVRSIAAGPRATFVEMFGLYWHFVDIVWVFLFPLLYLIDRT